MAVDITYWLMGIGVILRVNEHGNYAAWMTLGII